MNIDYVVIGIVILVTAVVFSGKLIAMLRSRRKRWDDEGDA